MEVTLMHVQISALSNIVVRLQFKLYGDPDELAYLI